jgi:hypothetical protein
MAAIATVVTADWPSHLFHGMTNVPTFGSGRNLGRLPFIEYAIERQEKINGIK